MIRVNQDFLAYIIKMNKLGSFPKMSEHQAMIGEKIIRQKTNVLAVYVLNSGIAKCFMTEDTGNDFVQEFFGAGEVFGEIEVLTNAISFCTIEALTPVQYFKIPHETFLDLVNNDPVFNRHVLKLMASKIRYTALRHSYHQSHTLADNLKRLLREFPLLLQQINKQDIANYLGVSVRSLNRVIQTLDDIMPDVRT